MDTYNAHISESQLDELSQAVRAMGILNFSFPKAGVFDTWIESEWFRIGAFIFRTKSSSDFNFRHLTIGNGADDDTSFNNRFLHATWWPEKIEVFEKRWPDDMIGDEGGEVWFDHAILFSLYLGGDKQRLCIGPQFSGMLLTATFDPKVIEDITGHCRVRRSV